MQLAPLHRLYTLVSYAKQRNEIAEGSQIYWYMWYEKLKLLTN